MSKPTVAQGMLAQLPAELIYNIAYYVPTASSLTNLAQTCRHLYGIISADDYRIFKAFIQGQFPSVQTPPLWKDAARALSARARAFDRRAIVGRFVLPPRNATRIGHQRTVRTDRPTLGYRPVVDSYETWYGGSWTARKEVLAWGAGAELVIRIKDLGQKDNESLDPGEKTGSLHRNGSHFYGSPYDSAEWFVYNDLHGVDSWDDISGVHLLGASQLQNTATDDEDIIYGRRNGAIVRMSLSAPEKSVTTQKHYVTGGRKLDYTDISTGPDTVLAAALDRKSIAFFRVDEEGDEIQPFANVKNVAHGSARNRCSKLLCDEHIAVGSDGETNRISIYDFTPDNVTKLRDMRVDDVDEGSAVKPRVTTLAPLATSYLAATKPGTIFLSGWEDSKTRLHDLRVASPYVSVFYDTVDDTPTYSLLPMGHERFLVGSGVNALVKVYDLRMPGKYTLSEPSKLSTSISNKNNQTDPTPTNNQTPNGAHHPFTHPISCPARDISLFVANRIPGSHGRTWAQGRPHRYRGPVYNMTLPSPSSSTLYVGVEDSIIRLDMASTDDLSGTDAEWYNQNLSSRLNVKSPLECQPFDLSCYQRPLPEDKGKGVRLHMQAPFWEEVGSGGGGDHQEDRKLPGWDTRWHLPSASRSNNSVRQWRR